MDQSLIPPPTSSLGHGRSITPLQYGLGDTTYEVFDPLNWMLDGLMEWPYSFSAQAVDASMGGTV